MNPKIAPDHLGRAAVVYIRQSTLAQVVGNLESQRRQYALVEAASFMRREGMVKRLPIYDLLAAISVGIVGGKEYLDLCYEEDSSAGVDMNVVMTGDGKLVEVQGTAEHGVFERKQLDQMMDLAARGVARLTELQKQAL